MRTFYTPYTAITNLPKRLDFSIAQPAIVSERKI